MSCSHCKSKVLHATEKPSVLSQDIKLLSTTVMLWILAAVLEVFFLFFFVRGQMCQLVPSHTHTPINQYMQPNLSSLQAYRLSSWRDSPVRGWVTLPYPDVLFAMFIWSVSCFDLLLIRGLHRPTEPDPPRELFNWVEEFIPLCGSVGYRQSCFLWWKGHCRLAIVINAATAAQIPLCSLDKPAVCSGGTV